MGRNGLISKSETAKMLGISTVAVTKWMKKGYLRPIYPESGRMRTPYFNIEEVSALKENYPKVYNQSEVALLSHKAAALSSMTARRLEEIEKFLGINFVRLEIDQESIEAFRLLIENAMSKDSSNLSLSELMDWARKLNAVDEHYLTLVRLMTNDEESWRHYYLMAQKLIEDMDQDRVRKNPVVATVFGYLTAARNNVQHACYFFLKNQNGKADDLFPEGDVDEEIIAFAFPQ